jgi:hypothetical protein
MLRGAIAALGTSLLCALGCAPVTSGATDAGQQDAALSSGALAPLGSGPTFMIDQMTLPPSGVGIDVDGNGSVDGHLNEAWRGMFVYMEQLVQSGIASGRFLTMVEFAGIDLPYGGDDAEVTVKYYRCDDADSDPTNNLCTDPGCGRMVADPEYLSAGQTVFRSLPVPILDQYVTAPVFGVLEMDIGQDQLLRVRRLHIAASLPLALDVIDDGLLCGVTTVRDADAMGFCVLMPQICVPLGMPADLSVAALLAVQGVQPDIDIDGDGLETYSVDLEGYVDLCVDGDGTEIPGQGCLSDIRMADGFSLCFAFHANRGELAMP